MIEEQSELQVPPYSEQAEDAVLGSILREGNKIVNNVLSWIRESDAFYRTDAQYLWNAIIELWKKGEFIDVITVHNQLKKNGTAQEGIVYWMTGLSDSVPSTANVESYAKIVWEKYIQRETAKSAYELYKASFENFRDVEDKLHKHGRLVDELVSISPTKKREISEIIDAGKIALYEGGNVIPFGISALDTPAGGMTRKEITVLGGRPGHGKTTLMLNIVKALLEQGYKVMLFNREMSNVEVYKKLLVMESNQLTYDFVRKSDITEDSKAIIDATSEVLKKKYKNLLMYDDIRTLDDSLREVSRYKPDIVVDDYIQLISTKKSREGRRFEIENIMQEYKWVAKKEDCSVLLVSQLNREIERRIDPIPRMSDYSESGVIEQTAETAMFVFYGYNFDSSSYGKYEAQLISAKTRYGQIGTYEVGFNGNKCKFYSNSLKAKEGDSNV